MKKSFKTIATLAIGIMVSVFAFANNGNGTTETKSEVKTRTIKVKDLSTIFGSNIVVEGNIDLNSLTEIEFVSMAKPCEELAADGFQFCGPAAAESRRIAAEAARQCCCDIVFGYECCDPATGTAKSVLFLTQAPANCN
jgi:hypothetical protein